MDDPEVILEVRIHACMMAADEGVMKDLGRATVHEIQLRGTGARVALRESSWDGNSV